MELGTGISIAGLGLSLTGVFAIVMRFLSASKDRATNDNSSSITYATREDIRAIESRLDEFYADLCSKIETRMREIRDTLKSREERCMSRAERIASIEQQQRQHTQIVNAISRREDKHAFKDGDVKAEIGFGHRKENGDKDKQTTYIGG